jgi:hypothetical protein
MQRDDDHDDETDGGTAVASRVVEQVGRARDRVFLAWVRTRERARELGALDDGEDPPRRTPTP